MSAPAARIGVGIVGGVAGLVRMIRRPPSPEPALAGLAAAVVPVAVPLFAAPAALLLAIGAGADLGVAIVVAAGLVATAALTAVAAVLPPDGAGHRVALWTGRLLAAAGVAACILLVVDGVYDV